VFTESPFSTPRTETVDTEAPSPWPAIAAASFAWLIALARLVVGQQRAERTDLDVVLALGATILIPSIVLVLWLNARRRRTQRAALDRPHLHLVAPSRPSTRTAVFVHRVARMQ